jgi:hypothetical protein
MTVDLLAFVADYPLPHPVGIGIANQLTPEPNCSGFHTSGSYIANGRRFPKVPGDEEEFIPLPE